MSFQIERGLFKFDFTDHHAILGIPVDADVKEVRKRYLKIARGLHPDTCKAESEAEKKQADQLLSKLVNPAYEQLSQSNREYAVSLGHLGRRLAAEGGKLPLASESAKRLAQGGANLDNLYKTSVQNLASKQYDPLDQALEKIAEISELNMVYLMLKEGRPGGSGTPKGAGTGAGRTSTGTGTGGGNTSTGTGASAGRTPTGTGAGGVSGGSRIPQFDSQGASRVDSYIRRAQGYMEKNNFAGAELELREALKLEPNNSNCHTLLAMAYLKQQGKAAMAKVHFNKALQLNPKDERALKGKQYLDNMAQKNTGGKQKESPKPEQGKPGDRKFWPFGGNKK